MWSEIEDIFIFWVAEFSANGFSKSYRNDQQDATV